jgi:alkylation response protein AidB-like acyl-CoA dehydrogenase
VTPEQEEILRTIRDFVDRDVLPNASRLDHADEFPTELVATMRELGLFGVTIPEQYGGLGLDLTTYALIIKELSRGWISLSGVINTHFMAAWMIESFGTEEQRSRLLAPMAAGDVRAAYSMTEAHAGSDVQAIRTRARRDGEGWTIDGRRGPRRRGGHRPRVQAVHGRGGAGTRERRGARRRRGHVRVRSGGALCAGA